MDPLLIYVAGAGLVLVGFVGLVKTRFTQVRRRLGSASSIRSRTRIGGSAVTTYQGAQPSAGQAISLLIMLLGGVVSFAGMMLS